MASCSSRTSSRPGSIYGGVGGLRNSFIDSNNISPETSPKRGHKSNNKRKTDSVGSDFSIESVNSLLSEEGSCQTYSSISTNKTDEAFKTLTHLLDNVNPPPASPPGLSELSAGLSPDNLMIKKETSASSIDDSCKELTSALEHQLHEIEKQVKHKQQRQNQNQNNQKPVPNTVATDSSPTAKGSNNKFGSSMREMLKSVVSSQKNVLTKKVETIEHHPNNSNISNSSVNSKVGKFFQTLTKNPLSKSNQSLAHSKESLNSNNFEQQHQVSSNTTKFYKTSATQAAVDSGKKRSKSLNSESRNTLSSGNKIRASGELVGHTNRSKWIGKNPFDLDKSPANEAYPKSPQWLGRSRTPHKDLLKKKVQHWESKNQA